MNIGEKSEVYLKAYLLREKDKNQENTIFKKITHLSDDVNLSKLTWTDKAEKYLEVYDVEKLNKELGLGKSSAQSKSDITINDVNYSVKEVNANPPSIINHTTRPGFERICSCLGIDIRTFDKIISEYWKKRTKGIIREDVINSDSESSPFYDHKEYLRPIINYFLFTGTGSCESEFPADKILELDYKNLPESIQVLEKNEYFDSIWQRLQISVRSKGMPKNYPECKGYDSIRKWTEISQGEYRGALSIRVRKK